ncbi:MAG: SDR family oxidoreductase [Sphingomonadales bacterium]|nr:SDR family oxidoreductase [Sphingomonadales bacterium]
MSLNGKVAIVTGAARGIGRGIALQLARDGARVVAWDVNGEGVRETAALIEAEGHACRAVTGDVASGEDRARILAQVRAECGTPLILVNNAAVAHFCPFLDISEGDLDRVWSVNLRRPFLLTQALVPGMVAAGWGRIINLSSASMQQGTKTLSHYAATKGGIMGFTRVVAMEFAHTGVTANCISPSFIDTPMRLDAKVPNFEAACAATPMRRAGLPADIANAVSFLAGDASAYITGQTLNVNGGLVLD